MRRSRVRVGLVGCGQIAQSVHLKVLSNLRGVSLAAIAEAHDQRREAAIALAPGVPAFSDYRELLALPDIDAVVLSLPTGLHASAAIAAFDTGKHVYLEKPLATDLGDAKAVLAAWRASGLVGMIGFNYRFNRLHREAKRLLEAAQLGRPVAVRSIFSSAARPLPDWKQKRESGGGVLLDLASHHIDLLRFLFGEPAREVTCSLHSAESEDDTATLQLRLLDGLLVQSFFSHCATDEDRFEIYCERGSIKVERRHGLAVEVSKGIDHAYRGDQFRHVWRSMRNAGYAMEKFREFGHEPSWRYALEHFVEALRGEHPASPDLEDGFRSLEIVLAAEESARTARTVEIGGEKEVGLERPILEPTGPLPHTPSPAGRQEKPSPRMSVIMVTPDRFDRLRHTIKRLREQTVVDQLEIVVVAPSKAEARVDEAQLRPFCMFQVVETGPTTSSAKGRAAGVRGATAPVIAFTEDHSFPSVGWAQALIEAHEQPWAAVGPAFLNGNPQSLVSWVNLLIEYGPWVWPVKAGPRDHIPGHNSSYKRDLLLAYGDRLEGLIEAESVLQWDLRSRGHGLYIEPAAQTRHFNISRVSVSIPLRLAVGRMFGAARARDWPLVKRLAYVAASPLIPLIRFARTLRFVRRCTAEYGIFPQVLPALFAGFVLDGVGESLGYAFRGGASVELASRLEYDRALHMRPEERQEFAQ